ncbi:hypothetical protein NE237_004267 [Protea cynaroides]|uniref:HP domain-containing protein n=1 Tax=Protea cynaroides TaxID=273540 RepID=A0A9Q0KIC9_9MAGN|nr:hypothetical protein NE237_004267 [Protea cynaroides]
MVIVVKMAGNTVVAEVEVEVVVKGMMPMIRIRRRLSLRLRKVGSSLDSIPSDLASAIGEGKIPGSIFLPICSPARGTRSPLADTSSAEMKSENANSEVNSQEGSPVKETQEGRISSVSESNGEESDVKDEIGGETYSYNQLNTKSTNPVSGIDFRRREFYLSDEEFQTILGMAKEAFYMQPRWKQDQQKNKVFLF